MKIKKVCINVYIQQYGTGVAVIISKCAPFTQNCQCGADADRVDMNYIIFVSSPADFDVFPWGRRGVLSAKRNTFARVVGFLLRAIQLGLSRCHPFSLSYAPPPQFSSRLVCRSYQFLLCCRSVLPSYVSKF